MKNYEDGIGDANSRIQKSFENTFKGIEKVFTNFFATGKIGIKDMVNVFISELAKLAAQAATAQLIGFIIGAAGTGRAPDPSLGTPVPPSNMAAKGGTVRPGSPFIVGEEGAELFVPGRVGTIVPNGAMTANQSQAPINVNFSISALDAEGIDEILVKKKNLLVSMMSQAMNQKGKTGLI
jgi:phage-related minor tail protein